MDWSNSWFIEFEANKLDWIGPLNSNLIQYLFLASIYYSTWYNFFEAAKSTVYCTISTECSVTGHSCPKWTVHNGLSPITLGCEHRDNQSKKKFLWKLNKKAKNSWISHKWALKQHQLRWNKAYTANKITNDSLTVNLSEQLISLSQLIVICEHLDSEHHRSRVTTREHSVETVQYISSAPVCTSWVLNWCKLDNCTAPTPVQRFQVVQCAVCSNLRKSGTGTFLLSQNERAKPNRTAL